MTDEEIQRVAKETGTPEAVIRTALPLIPVDKHSEWIGLLKSDNAASKMAHSYGWTLGHAISYIRGTSPPRKTSPNKFRFTIRDLLWLTVVVAVLAAWWLDHRLTRYRIYISNDGQTMTVEDTRSRNIVTMPSDLLYHTQLSPPR